MDEVLIPNCDADLKSIIILCLWFGHSVFEYWLGKTRKVKACSTWDLVFAGFLAFFLYIQYKYKKTGD